MVPLPLCFILTLAPAKQAKAHKRGSWLLRSRVRVPYMQTAIAEAIFVSKGSTNCRSGKV